MSQSYVTSNLAPNEVKEDAKDRPNPSPSKLHRVLLEHMTKNSKQVESKTEA